MSAPAASFPWAGQFGPLLIAEIGGNHEGDFAAALRMTALALEAQADVVKFQLYTGDSLVSPVEAPDRHRHFQRFELSPEQHITIAKTVREKGKRYGASVWDMDMLSWIDPFLDFYKIGSGDLTAYPVLKRLAQTGKPLALSTGLSELGEVLDAVRFIQSIDARYQRADFLAVLQCTSMYPTEAHDVHLAAMDELRAHTGLAVGYSHHCQNQLALLFAAARGAQILEFHFTESREGKSFRDHAISLTAAELSALTDSLTLLKTMLGSAHKVALPSEHAAGHVQSFRRAAYSRRALKKGERMRAQDLIYLRPDHGISAAHFERLPGQVARCDVAAFARLDEAFTLAPHSEPEL